MDPFQMGLLTLGMGQNPELFSSVMAGQGLSPTAAPNTTMPFAAGNLGAAMMPGTPLPGAAPAAPAGGPGLQSALAAMKGVKAPEANKPIMNAGVSGAQKAPEVSAGAQGSQALMALMKMLQAPPATQAAPNLGALLKGI